MSKGQGTKVTPGEKRRFEKLRAAGFSPGEAAKTIGRSQSWGYLYEAQKAEGHARSRRDPVPNQNLKEMVDLTIYSKKGPDEKAFAIVDRFGAGVVPYMAELVWFFATERALNLQGSLEEMFEDEEWLDEVKAEPITAEDILYQVPINIDRARAGIKLRNSWMPPRAEEWMARFIASYPELRELDEMIDAAFEEADPESAVRRIARSIIREDVEEERGTDHA